MSTHNICFHGDIRKYQCFLVEKSVLSRALFYDFSHLLLHIFTNMYFIAPQHQLPGGIKILHIK